MRDSDGVGRLFGGGGVRGQTKTRSPPLEINPTFEPFPSSKLQDFLPLLIPGGEEDGMKHIMHNYLVLGTKGAMVLLDRIVGAF